MKAFKYALTATVVLALTLTFLEPRRHDDGQSDPSNQRQKSNLKTSQRLGTDTNPGERRGIELLRKAALAADRFQRLPFSPEYGEAQFDETAPLTEELREKWKRHCLLRETYASPRIHEPAFLELYQVSQDYGLSRDIVKLKYLHNIARSLSEAANHATGYSEELVSEETKLELDTFFQDLIETYRWNIANIYAINVTDELMDAIMEIHPSGPIDTANTHVTPGERMLIN